MVFNFYQYIQVREEAIVQLEQSLLTIHGEKCCNNRILKNIKNFERNETT